MRSTTIIAISLVFCAAASAKDTFIGKCVGITDGDTIKVMRDGKAVKVRLHGVDCPERRQAFGTKAKKFTSDLVFGKQVTVEVLSKHYDRLVGRVVLPDGRCLNEELVKAGLAWWSDKYAKNDLVLKQAEREARKLKKGLWKYKDPVPPWKFRKKSSKRPSPEPSRIKRGGTAIPSGTVDNTEDAAGTAARKKKSELVPSQKGPEGPVDICASFNKNRLTKNEHKRRYGCPPCPCSCSNGKITCAPCVRCVPKFDKEVAPVLAPKKQQQLEKNR